MPGVAERLLAAFPDLSLVQVAYVALGVIAWDLHRHVMVPVFRAWGARWAAMIEARPVARDRPRAPSRRRGR